MKIGWVESSNPGAWSRTTRIWSGTFPAKEHNSGDEDHRDGFTLVEMLVALALLALLSTLTIAIINQIRPVARISDHYRTRMLADDIAAIMASEIEGALRLPLIDGNETIGESLIGDPHHIRFTANVPIGFREFGLREVRFEMSSNANVSSSELVRRTAMRRYSNSQSSRREASNVLIRSIAKLDFRYLALDENGAPVWASDWNRTGALPSGVSVSITVLSDGNASSATRLARMPRE